MAPPDSPLALNRAASQRDREEGAPAPDRVQVDGRSLADLLAFAAEYGELVLFYNLDKEADGNWSVFFRSDPSIALALRAGLDLAGVQGEFDRLLQEARDAPTLAERLAKLEQAIAVLLRLARILTGEGGDQPRIEPALAALAGSARRDLLAAPAQALGAHLAGLTPEQGLKRDLQARASGWFDQLVDYLEDLVASLLTALGQDRAAALAELELSFHDQTHPPQSALYDAFAKLFGHAQASINRFPEKLVDFYRAKILHQTSGPPRPDSLCLTFTTAKDVDRADLPAGTAFLAGVDGDGADIAYALETALTVDAAALAALDTLTVTHDSSGRPAQLLAGTVALAKTPPAIAQPFPIFGAQAVGTSGALTSTLATLGFSLASPALLLAGGSRTISLGLAIAPASLTALEPRLAEIAAATGLTPMAVLAALLEKSFALSWSSAKGWAAIPAYRVAPSSVEGDPLFVLWFTLDHDADAFVAPDAASQPTLVAQLVQDPVTLGAATLVYPYEILSQLALSALAVTVDVAGLADLEVWAAGAPVDPSQPFAPFGSPPVQFAALEIAAPELFVKPVERLDLALDWAGLPVTTTGFKGYYEAYVIDADGNTVAPGKLFDNQSFTTQIDLVNPGAWAIAGDPQYLFQTTPGDPTPVEDGTLQPHTILVAAVAPHAPPLSYDPSLSRIRLGLAAPAVAFGNVLYAPNVMAASVQLTAAASACAQQCGSSGGGGTGGNDPAAHLAPVAAANASAQDSQLEPALRDATRRAVANLDGAALKAIEDAIAASDVPAETQAAWQDNLTATLGAPKAASLLQRLFWWRARTPDFATVHANLDAWLKENVAAIETRLPALLEQARAMLDAGTNLLALQDKAAGQPPSVARPIAAAGLREVQTRLAGTQNADTSDCVAGCLANANLAAFPNQPWLPMLASLSLDYTARIALPAPDYDDIETILSHLLPLGGTRPVDWPKGQDIPLLFPVESAGSLYITLSDPAETITLLFRLSPPATGWPVDTPPLAWAQAEATGWAPLTPQADTTNGLRNTGIVALAPDPQNAVYMVRISVALSAETFPMLADLVPNAAMAQWIGPGGADALGTPVPAGTVIKPLVPQPLLGTIDQPMASSGGAPATQGAAFGMWLAERLRHKDRGIQDWDYARLVLAAFPSLWQVAVVPASDGSLVEAPGNVWIVPIPGPQTPAVSDPTIPSSNTTLLGDVAAYLQSRISQFIQLTVTNPPYRAVTVVATVVFVAEDAVEASGDRLNRELIAYLSPWPPSDLPPRPDDYFTLRQIAHFIRHRPYVRGILKIALDMDEGPGWHYLTSAAAHRITGVAQPAPEAAHPPRLALPDAAS